MNPGRALGTFIGPWLLLWAGCVSPLQAPSAFSGERYLCDEKSAPEWEARLEACRATYAQDGSCLGVISMRGVIDAQSVVVDSPVTGLTITDTPRSDGTISRAVFITALSPYFRFSFDLPGFHDPGHNTSGFVQPASCTALAGVVPCFAGVLNIEARGGTYLSELSTLLQNIKVDTADELRVAFAADIVRGGDLTGCFDLNLAPAP